MSATHKLLRFGVFELNLATEELRKHGTQIKLAPQPFRLLALLADHSGPVVSRQEIHKQLWDDDTFVDFEQGMNKCIKQIRSVLSDNADKPLYIETIPRHGYRFLAPVVSKVVAAPAPKVTDASSGIVSVKDVGAGSLRVRTTNDPSAAVDRDVPSIPLTESVSSSLARGAAVAMAREPVQPASTEPHRRKLRGPLAWTVLGVIVVVAFGIYWRTQRASALTEKDTIILADFDNKTGDPVFDDTLKQGLAVQLEQSPFLDLLSEGKVNRTLKLMGRQAGDRLTPEVAREVCQRTASKAMLRGSIAELGSQFVIGLEAVNCSTGEILGEAQEQAASKEAVLKALDAAAIRLRRKLGESFRSVQKYATPVEEATTPSLDALKAYSLARKMQFAKGYTAALPLYKRAVELDPNFAMAYSAMSSAYSNLNEVGRASENARTAYKLGGKVSERERFSVEANYYLYATGELEKAAEVYQLWQQTYPRDSVPYTNLGFTYSSLGNWEKVMEEAGEAVRLEPNNATNYSNLGGAYTSLNRLDEAEATYRQADERKLEGEFLLGNRYQLAFLKGDTSQMARIASTAVGKSGTEDVLLAAQADTEAWYGRLTNARELTRRAMDSARRSDAEETAAEYQALAALREVESGNRKRAQADADAALELAPTLNNVQAIVALALARAGDASGAEKLAAQLDKTFPLDTLVQRYWLPTIRAAIALERRDPNRAVDLLKVASTIELGQPTGLAVFLCPVYLRGEAYLMLGDGEAAAIEFQKFIDHRGLVVNFPWGALARLGLARAHAMRGDTVKARAAYRDFFTLWKNADPDVPILQQAKAEYAALTKTSSAPPITF